jgi:RimJ/RimL family protein N-acetyltransferase
MEGDIELEFELQPTLVGRLVTLRPLGTDEFETLYRVASDPLIWEQHPESDRYERDVFQRFFDGAIESGGAFAVIDNASGRMIGSSRYCNRKPEKSEVEVGYTFLERAYWGGTYNAEMKRLMLDHAFRFVERVVFSVGENNVRSRKAMEKIGARLEGTSAGVARDGSPRRSVVYVITRESWSRGDSGRSSGAQPESGAE